jgi:hypothetical protein
MPDWNDHFSAIIPAPFLSSLVWRWGVDLNFLPGAEVELMVTHAETRSFAQFARNMFLGILAALLAVAAPGRAKAQARKIELGDLQRIVKVSSPEISPDGSPSSSLRQVRSGR